MPLCEVSTAATALATPFATGLAAGGSQDTASTGSGRADVEASVDDHLRLVPSLDPAVPFVLEPFTLRLELLVERAFLDERVIAPSLRALDVPALLWTGLGDGAGSSGGSNDVLNRDPSGSGIVRLPAAGHDARLSVALDGVTGLARRDPDREIDGALWAVFAVELQLRADRPDALAALAPRAQLATAEQFRTDLFGERLPLDRRDLEVRADADWRPELRALPTQGAPAGFEGVVGEFELDVADVRPMEVAVNDAFEVDLHVRGERNLDLVRVSPPRSGADPSYHLLGVRARALPQVLEFTYEFVALGSGSASGPRFELDVFEPGVGYRTLAVTAKAPSVLADTGGDPDRSVSTASSGLAEARDAHSSETEEAGASTHVDPARIALLAAVLAIFVGGGAWLVLRTRSRRAAGDPLAAEAEALARAASGPWRALGAFVRTRLALPAAAEQGDGVAAALVGAGVAAQLAQRVEVGLTTATAARFSQAPLPTGGGDLLEAVRLALDEAAAR